jgi:hypothetical protein
MRGYNQTTEFFSEQQKWRKKVLRFQRKLELEGYVFSPNGRNSVISDDLKVSIDYDQLIITFSDNLNRQDIITNEEEFTAFLLGLLFREGLKMLLENKSKTLAYIATAYLSATIANKANELLYGDNLSTVPILFSGLLGMYAANKIAPNLPSFKKLSEIFPFNRPNPCNI